MCACNPNTCAIFKHGYLPAGASPDLCEEKQLHLCRCPAALAILSCCRVTAGFTVPSVNIAGTLRASPTPPSTPSSLSPPSSSSPSSLLSPPSPAPHLRFCQEPLPSSFFHTWSCTGTSQIPQSRLEEEVEGGGWGNLLEEMLHSWGPHNTQCHLPAVPRGGQSSTERTRLN